MEGWKSPTEKLYPLFKAIRSTTSLQILLLRFLLSLPEWAKSATTNNGLKESLHSKPVFTIFFILVEKPVHLHVRGSPVFQSRSRELLGLFDCVD